LTAKLAVEAGEEEIVQSLKPIRWEIMNFGLCNAVDRGGRSGHAHQCRRQAAAELVEGVKQPAKHDANCPVID
jgi:hypothetical protein